MSDDASTIEQFKVKKLVKNLSLARGNGTSMISLVIRPKDEIAKVNKMLTDEYGTASNIKSRVNRMSVLSAITSAQQKLKLYNRTPKNGLVIYCGTVLTDDGKEKKVNVDFEPFKPVNTSLYLCDNKFHVEPLQELLESNDRYGFIIMDGHGCLFATLQGNVRTILNSFSVDLPKKHGRGGQSALRFARLRIEKRHNYVRRVAEVAVSCFITNDKVNVNGIIMAGSADFKTDLAQSDLFDQRIGAKIINVVDVNYGGENGLNQAIELSQNALADVKLLHEKKVIAKFFEEVNCDTGKYIFGVEDTLKGLDMGCIETIIVWEGLETNRVELKNPLNGNIVVKTHTPSATARHGVQENFKCPETGADLELVHQEPLIDWLVENYQGFGADIEFITNASQEGAQFQKGFGGIGGILRYKVDFEEINHENYLSDSDSSDDFM